MARRGFAIAKLTCKKLSVAVNSRTLLDDLSIEVASGSICAIVGASGSGKTTLLSSIAGFVPLTAGQVLIDSVDVSSRKPKDRGVTMLFQEPRLFPALSVLENVAFARRVRGDNATVRRSHAEVLLTQVGLIDRGDDSVEGLSGGEQQRVALARGICADPEVVLLDEPFSAVDAPRRKELISLVARLQAEHKATMVLVTHDIRDAQRLADTLAVLIDGRLVQHDKIEKVISNPYSEAVSELVSLD